jgi:thiol-disulfide isomerase/thioredoxin
MAKVDNAKKQIKKKANIAKKNVNNSVKNAKSVTKKVEEKVTEISDNIEDSIEEVEEKVVSKKENKNKRLITILGIVLAIGLFVGLSFLIDASGKESENDDNDSTGTTADIESWYNKSTNGDEIVTVIASSTCPHCQEYKPVIENLASEKGFTLYFFEADYLDETDYAMLTGTFEIENYTGSVPYTFIVRDGKFVADTIGYSDEDTIVSFLEENNIIK